MKVLERKERVESELNLEGIERLVRAKIKGVYGIIWRNKVKVEIINKLYL